MNERIKLLSESAHHSTADELAHLQRVHNRTYDLYEAAEIYNEKFAELIVRECMGMATELEAQYFNNRKEQTDPKMKKIYTEGEAACDILRFKMKQHFGVEE